MVILGPTDMKHHDSIDHMTKNTTNPFPIRASYGKALRIPITALALALIAPLASKGQTSSAPAITSSGTANSQVAQAFSYQITASNSPTAYGASGLPTGLLCNATTGLISGTPTGIDGLYNATLSATNASGTGRKILTLTVAPTLPVITSRVVALGTQGVAFRYAITSLNHPRSFSTTPLPAGLSLNATTGLITGTPATLGNSSITLSATNGAGSGTKSITISILPPAPVITSAGVANSKVGNSFLYQTTATNSPTSFSLSGRLPSGLTFNATNGRISGTVRGIDGNYTLTLNATNAGGTGNKTLTLVVAPTLPVLGGNSTARGVVGTPFLYTANATNYPRTYGASGLPAGLTINSTTGNITGSPTVAGNSTFNLTATNGAGTATKSIAVSILPQKPVVTSSGSASAKVGTPFSYRITATNTPTKFWASTLPAGLVVNATTGNITGTPTAIDGIYNATISATNAGGTGAKILAITVAPTLPVINNSAAISLSAGTPLTYRISATNYPRSFQATSLPAGLTINTATGVVTGIPTTPGNSTVTLSATNGAGTASKQIPFSITPAAIQITTSSLSSAILGQAYGNLTLTASGGWGGNIWSIPTGFLPAGMTLNANTGTLSGTPTGTAGVYSFVLRVQDSKLLWDEIDVVLEVVNPAAASHTASILDVIPGGGAPQSPGNATFSTVYQSSNSTWTAGLNEQDVFLASLTTPNYRLGIGKGGQIYSLRGAFGESVPPQRTAGPWVDEVWQFVATNTDLVSPIQAFQALSAENRQLGFPMQFFIHQSGIYLAGLAGNNIVGAATAPFYSPTLKTNWNPATRTFSVVSWSQMARSPNVWKSGMLTYASYRDLGNGTIEATNVVTNFGDQDLKFINTPWGGVRQSSLPTAALSTANGSYSVVTGAFPSAAVQLRNTGGWHAWTQASPQNTSPSLALVFGKDFLPTGLPGWRAGVANFRYGTAGSVLDRNYQVAEASALVRLQKGHTMAARWHLVADGFLSARTKANALAPYAGIWMPTLDSTAATPVWVSGGQPSDTGTGQPSTYLYAHPVPGTVPVFAMEDTRNGQIFAVFDPYTLTPTAPFPNPLPLNHAQRALYQNRVLYYQYESPGVVRKLLGYARKQNLPGGGCVHFGLPGLNGSTLHVWGPPGPVE
jgi:PKD repeat protein